jgi:hypothetical protein
VILDEGLEETEDGAFRGCTQLSRAILGEGLEEIGACAFEDCTSLNET